jgi:pimeloyl-ACP methyl ester carboxylesterase
MRLPRSRLVACALFLPVSIAACAETRPETKPDPEPEAYAPPPASAVVESGTVKIRREVFLVPGEAPPPNPDVPKDKGETPAENNFVRVVRYRVDADPPVAARAVFVLMPGFLGGAGSYDSLARAVVRRSKGGESFEAWAIDRRSNLLEDHHGLDVAEVKKDPEAARAYYFDGTEVEKRTFGGFLAGADMLFASEWGIPTTIGDLRRVIDLVPAAERRARVVLVGHSFGATIVEEFAAWDFDGKPGYSDLAGLVLVDGVSGAEGDTTPPVPQDEYENGGPNGIFGSSPGVKGIRNGTTYFALPLLGVKVYPVASIASLRAQLSPEEIIEDDVDRDNAFRTLLSLTDMPKMTNRAAAGLAFDDESNGVSFAAVSCGSSKGGALEEYTSLFGSTLVHPSDPTATYDWTEFDAVSPVEHTSLDDITRSWFEGPGLDFAEWYYPYRLSLDGPIASTLVLKQGDFAFDLYGMRAIHGSKMDLPILAAAAGLVPDPASWDKLRGLVQDVPIGPDRPLAGTPRSDEAAFGIIDVHQLTHIDPLSGTDTGKGIVSGWYDSLVAFAVKNTSAGGVSVPVQKAP